MSYIDESLFRFTRLFIKKNNFAMLVIIFIYSDLLIMAHSTIQHIKSF